MDTEDTTINTHAIGDAIDLWATMLMFRSANNHIPPMDMDWDILYEEIGLSSDGKRKMLQRTRERLVTRRDTL